jgi:uncharacterized membrane protein YbhN (UPF0104 family)
MVTGHPDGGKSTRKILAILRIIGAPALLVIIMWRVDLGEMIAAFGRIRILPFAGAAILIAVNFALQIIKWRYLLSPAVRVTRADLIRSLMGGYAFVLATPGRVGEFSRALFIPGESRLKIMGLVAVDKLTTFSIILLASSLSLALWRPEPFFLLPLGALGLFILLAFQPRFLVMAARKLSPLLPWRDKIALFLEGIQTLSGRRILVLLLLSLLLFLVYSVQFYLLLSAFEAVGKRVMIICFPLVTLINSVPITIGGLGIREGAAVLLFTQFGVQGSSALGAALLLFAINILIPGLCGLAFIHQIGSHAKPLMEKNP